MPSAYKSAVKVKAMLVQNPVREVPAEILADAIVDVSHGIKKLLDGPITMDGLILLIQQSAPKQSNGSPYSKETIKDIISGINDIEKKFVKSNYKRKGLT